MQIAVVLYPTFTALDFIGPYEVLRNLPDAEVRFVWHEPGPVTADSGVLMVGATHTFDETPSPDVVLVPGGPAVRRPRATNAYSPGCARCIPRPTGWLRCARGRWCSPRRVCSTGNARRRTGVP